MALENYLSNLRELIRAEEQRLAGLRARVVEVNEQIIMQEAGVYIYQHPLENAAAYKAELERIKAEIKTMTKSGKAVAGGDNWYVNGSRAEGARQVRDFSKIMLRAYNIEADNCIRTLRPHRLRTALDRLQKAGESIVKLGASMGIYITDDYHRLRVREIRLTADHLAKVEEEKEAARADRERQRENERAQRELEREKERLFKEQAHHETVLAKLLANGDEQGAATLRAKLEEIGFAIDDVEAREANIRAGYVYVISNVGAFGEGVVKIGLTRRLDPSERVRELGDASVPFRFDTHALIFSQDAVGLEQLLHRELADRRVNKVNPRREFFYATPAEVRSILERLDSQHLLEYAEQPEALEWRQSQTMGGA
ncbi:DUF4041 domain-containing protein [Nonomuraea sp. NPDC005692]|uniref:DUF4041 domain-containing protein n=1 Tax=Nonomuraea sp. NPDC005692 TaxID=3157168 RepID=UPI0033EEE512